MKGDFLSMIAPSTQSARILVTAQVKNRSTQRRKLTRNNNQMENRVN
jgi:hypothetical protein